VGHIHLNSLPDTAPWREVVGLIADGADVAVVAESATTAATAGLDRARNDPGVSVPLFLLTKVALAAQQGNVAEGLRAAGIRVSHAPNVMEIVSGFSEAADQHLRMAGRTDLGEMARLSATEALTGLLSQRSANLFETTPAEVQQAARGLSTQTGFARLAHEFYTCFTRRFLTYHLDRELGLHVGGNGVFDDAKAHNEFNRQLSVHCREAAEITRRYAGDWYSKHKSLGGITKPKARTFVRYCLKKLRTELAIRGARHG
jgi:hypothetical protein